MSEVQFKMCKVCEESLSLSNFRLHRDGRVENTCRKCESNQAMQRIESKMSPEQLTKLYIKRALAVLDYKSCIECLEWLPKTADYFYEETNRFGNLVLRSDCKRCKDKVSAITAKQRRAVTLSARPSWADKKELRKIYQNCPQGYEVDHIIPLQNKIVCGLHVPANLQYLPAMENRQKSNRFIGVD